MMVVHVFEPYTTPRRELRAVCREVLEIDHLRGAELEQLMARRTASA